MADPGDLVVTIRRFSSDGDAMVDFTVDLAGKPKDGAVPLDHGGCGEDFLGEAALVRQIEAEAFRWFAVRSSLDAAELTFTADGKLKGTVLGYPCPRCRGRREVLSDDCPVALVDCPVCTKAGAGGNP